MAKNKHKCHNCKHGGEQFKVFGMTHLHCCHPKYKDEYENNKTFSAWDTLMEFWHTCKDWEAKPSKSLNCL